MGVGSFLNTLVCSAKSRGSNSCWKSTWFFSNNNQKLLDSFFREIEASYHQLDCQCQSTSWRLEVMRFFIQFPFVGKPLLFGKVGMIELLKTFKLLVIDQTLLYWTQNRLEHHFRTSKELIHVNIDFKMMDIKHQIRPIAKNHSKLYLDVFTFG